MVSDEDFGLKRLFQVVEPNKNIMEFKPPDQLSLQGNIADNWRLWEQHFKNFITAKEADEKPDAVKIAMLLTCVGPDAMDRYNQFEYREQESADSYTDVMAKFSTHFNGLKRTVFARYKFWTHKRGDGQPFEEYLT
jgi:hypothetical protein